MIKDQKGVLNPPQKPETFLIIAPELGDIVGFDFVKLMI